MENETLYKSKMKALINKSWENMDYLFNFLALSKV